MSVGSAVPDQEFANPRLAKLYDLLGGERDDLAPYLVMIEEFEARSVLDFGCGTGTLFSLLSNNDLELIGVDPAQASLELAKTKPGANQVQWILGGAKDLGGIRVDLIVMTGNVAQVFLEDADWLCTLKCLRQALVPGGYLVFETRNPGERAWAEWTREKTHKKVVLPNIGPVEYWNEVTDISFPFVSFNWTFSFADDGALLTSNSTLRFRGKDEIKKSLVASGFELKHIRNAPDRPGQEWVFVATAVS